MAGHWLVHKLTLSYYIEWGPFRASGGLIRNDWFWRFRFGFGEGDDILECELVFKCCKSRRIIAEFLVQSQFRLPNNGWLGDASGISAFLSFHNDLFEFLQIGGWLGFWADDLIVFLFSIIHWPRTLVILREHLEVILLWLISALTASSWGDRHSVLLQYFHFLQNPLLPITLTRRWYMV